MPIKISAAEWEVLNVVWDRAPATASDIFAALGAEKEWHPKTVNTFLTRLVGKGILEVKRDGRTNVYSPLKSRQECVSTESETFINRVFRGAFGPMLLHFVEQADLTQNEIGELERVLREKRK